LASRSTPRATAEKKGLLREEDRGCAAGWMMRLNAIGADLARLEGVHAMTDVTGFGLLGHLREMCEAGNVVARIDFSAVPMLTDLTPYLEAGIVPGGTRRNWESYGSMIDCPDDERRAILCDPQTSGGLLVAVAPEATGEIEALFAAHAIPAPARPLGTIIAADGGGPRIRVS